MALVTMATIMPSLSVPTVIIPIIPMIARRTASMDQTGSQAASLLEPGRGFMASGAATGAEVITDAVALAADVAVLAADAVGSAADMAGSAADVAGSAADMAGSAADVAGSAADVAAEVAASVADVAAAVDSTEVVEAGSTAAAAAVPMAVGMVVATDN